MSLAVATVAVTGGACGIGTALANAFRTTGGSVVTMDLPGTGADVTLDVTDRAATKLAFASLEWLDIVVANAGVGVSGLVGDLDDDAWTRVIDVSIVGTATLLAALPMLRRQGSGAVVIMASLAGLVPTPLLTPDAMTSASRGAQRPGTWRRTCGQSCTRQWADAAVGRRGAVVLLHGVSGSAS